MGKQHLGPNVVVGYGIKIFWPGLFITSPDHLEGLLPTIRHFENRRGEGPGDEVARVFYRRSAILKIVEEKALGTRLPQEVKET